MGIEPMIGALQAPPLPLGDRAKLVFRSGCRVFGRAYSLLEACWPSKRAAWLKNKNRPAEFLLASG